MKKHYFLLFCFQFFIQLQLDASEGNPSTPMKTITGNFEEDFGFVPNHKLHQKRSTSRGESTALVKRSNGEERKDGREVFPVETYDIAGELKYYGDIFYRIFHSIFIFPTSEKREESSTRRPRSTHRSSFQRTSIAGPIDSKDEKLEEYWDEAGPIDPKDEKKEEVFDPTKDGILGQSYLEEEYRKQLLRLKIVLHPLLHGFGEKKEKSLLNRAREIGRDIRAGDVNELWKKTAQDPALCQMLKTALGGLLAKYAGREMERVIFHGGFYDRSELSAEGQSSMDALLTLENDLRGKFPEWSEDRCAEGFLNCSRLGFYSKLYLKKLHQFIENIREYQEKTGYDFFEKEDVQRIMQFVDRSITRICQENVKGLFGSSGGKGIQTAVNDEVLKPYCKIMDYFLAVPTEIHDVEASWEKNAQEVEKALSSLPNDPQQRSLYDYMLLLAKRAKDSSYGHKEGDSGIHLVLAGDTGTGKTYIGEKLQSLLEFPIITMSLEQFKDGQRLQCAEIEDLVDEKLSDFEQPILQVNIEGKKSKSVLNQVIFVDEADYADEECSLSIAQLKDQFDQFKRIFLPSLGIHLPGFFNCIFTTNNKKYLKDQALGTRFTQIILPPMTEDRKCGILFSHLDAKLQKRSNLLLLVKKEDIQKMIIQAVRFHDEIANIRVLISNLDSILNHIELRQKINSGEVDSRKDFRIPPHDRQHGLETYDQFLERKFAPALLVKK